MATGFGDNTINKVAICSAVVAGFAYAGYSFIKDKSNWKRRRKSADSESIALNKHCTQYSYSYLFKIPSIIFYINF